MKSIAVFCGSRNGKSLGFKELGQQVGELLSELNFRIIYGGAKIGIMGAVADGALSKSGKVVGVIPQKLAELGERAHENLTELIFVDSMEERKKIMFEKSDLVLILPGGLGTLDELFEVATANQLGLLNLPIFILNHDHFYSPLLSMMKKMREEKFITDQNFEDLKFLDSLSALKQNLSISCQ